jgi:quinoprotein dehydrogenase-associated probable ABC transporter substrate-binding protein
MTGSANQRMVAGALLVGVCCGGFGTVWAATPAGAALKVCSDPSNLPLSNDKGEGYENKIAAAMAADMGKKVEYTFFSQRMGFIRNTLRARDDTGTQFKCDLIIGVPKGYELTATTQPYLHSTYSLIYKPHGDIRDFHAPDDLLKLSPDKIAKLRIGIFSNTPGSDWVLKHSMVDNAAMFQHQNGDVQETPARTMERAIANGSIDAGIVWGPFAGMLLREHKDWQAVSFAPDPDIHWDFEIAMGTRQGEKEWKDTVDGWISGHRPQIAEILKSYQIPVVDAAGHVQM